MHIARLSHTHTASCPAVAIQPATKHKTLSIINPASPAQAKRSENLDNAMHCRSCAPAILIITLTLLGRPWRGMALRTSTARKGPLTSAASSEPSFQSGPVILNMEVASRTSPSKSGTAIILLLFFYSSPYRFGHEYGALELSHVCQ